MCRILKRGCSLGTATPSSSEPLHWRVLAAGPVLRDRACGRQPVRSCPDKWMCLVAHSGSGRQCAPSPILEGANFRSELSEANPMTNAVAWPAGMIPTEEHHAALEYA